MMGGLDGLFAATVLFVAGHFILSHSSVRPALVARLGEGRFRGIYAAVATVALVWMILSYRTAPYMELWPQLPALRWVPVLVMPFAFILVVAGLTTPNATAVMSEARASEPPAPRGIMRITRHPFLWGVTLWAASHLVVNGDAASLILMGGVLVLALGGMAHIDRKRERQLGSAWGPIALTTSVIPFAAIAAGRAQLDWAGIGWWRPLLGLVLYLGIFHAHRLIFGVSAMPV